MKKWILLFIGLSLMIPRSFAQSDEEKERERFKVDKWTFIKTGVQVPDFEVKMFDGKVVNMSELKGKVVLINFWATWCSLCLKELDRAQEEIINRFKSENFVFLPISCGDTYEKIKNYRERSGNTFPMGMDEDKTVFSKFAEKYLPRNYIVDKEGRISYTKMGYSEKAIDELVAELESLL